MAKKKMSQREKLLNYFKTGKKLTTEQAFKKFGTKNLRARVNDFRKDGMEIMIVKTSKNSSKNAYVMF